MMADPAANIPLMAAVFVVALLYSSVGHGGASGYLAILAFSSLSPAAMSSSALLLNLLVAGVSFYAFFRASHFSWRLAWPFVISSIPAAFIGGMIHVPREIYSFLLIAVFLFAAFRLGFFPNNRDDNETDCRPPAPALAAGIGLFLGLLSGIVGVGGGIFLSPLLLLLNWAGPKRTAATSAFFIWVNSFSGLLGRGFGGQLEISSYFSLLVVVAFFGSLMGSGLGALVFPGVAIRRVLAFVLFFATVKLFNVYFF